MSHRTKPGQYCAQSIDRRDIHVARKLYVNIAVKDLDRAVAFFTKLGFTFDPRFTDEHASGMTINDDTGVMLLDHVRFADFTKKSIVDSHSGTEAILAFSAESRAEVDEITDTALAAGGSAANDPQDHGFMYTRSFHDPDGHLWEVMYMDMAAFEQMAAAEQH
jgi:uncharacterized protein